MRSSPSRSLETIKSRSVRLIWKLPSSVARCKAGSILLKTKFWNWYYYDIMLCPLEFCFRRLGGRGSETPQGPDLTDAVDKLGDASAVPPIWVLWRQFSSHWPSLP